MADNNHIYHVSMNFGLVWILSEFLVTRTVINYYIPVQEIYPEIFCWKISLKKVNSSDGNNPKYFIFNSFKTWRQRIFLFFYWWLKQLHFFHRLNWFWKELKQPGESANVCVCAKSRITLSYFSYHPHDMKQ